jgi:hypothetical protein
MVLDSLLHPAPYGTPMLWCPIYGCLFLDSFDISWMDNNFIDDIVLWVYSKG